MPHGSRCAYPKVGDGSYCHIHSPDAKKRQADAEAAANAERQREFEKFDRLAKLKPNKPKKVRICARRALAGRPRPRPGMRCVLYRLGAS